MDDRLLSYVLGNSDSADRKAIEARITADPALAAELEKLQTLLSPLSLINEPIEPPAGLVEATLARTATAIVEQGLGDDLVELSAPRRVSDTFSGFGIRFFDLLVAASVAFVTIGFGVVGLGKLRHERETASCSNQLRTIHTSLIDYAGVHEGKLPQIGTPGLPTAGRFVPELKQSGQLPLEFRAVCALSDPEMVKSDESYLPASEVGYTYSLGYRDGNGPLNGVRFPDGLVGDEEGTPVAADLKRGVHGTGQNVLFLGGAVRYTTSTEVGINNDEIFHNNHNLIRAGLERTDASLGRPSDCP